MRTLFEKLMRDQQGMILSSEVVLIGTILVLGSIVGLTAVSHAVTVNSTISPTPIRQIQLFPAAALRTGQQTRTTTLLLTVRVCRRWPDTNSEQPERRWQGLTVAGIPQTDLKKHAKPPSDLQQAAFFLPKAFSGPRFFPAHDFFIAWKRPRLPNAQSTVR